MKIDPVAWLSIPGFPGYEIRADGAIRKRNPKGFRPIYTRIYRGVRIVSMSVDGSQKTCRVAHLLGRAFLRKLRKGECYSHRNWDVLDDVASNICIRTHSEIGKRSGELGTRRRAVEQVDAEGKCHWGISEHKAGGEGNVPFSSVRD